MATVAGGMRGIIIGLDEVGRGAVAGPLTVAAVALPWQPVISGLDDSKKLSASRRQKLSAVISQVALTIGIFHVEAAQIDELGMSAALRLAFSQALASAVDTGNVEPDLVLVDGYAQNIHAKELAVPKADSRFACVAAASIIAKVCRDAIMVAATTAYDGYDFDQHKGYGTAAHIAAIRELGLCDLHRQSFCRNFLDTPNTPNTPNTPS
ncbi:MAG: ribonuclease HII [Coriobacteriales bacterium]|jgi:ribonuclease HII|nr:ribonuclease HII [Coriobacteriales bacterium]